MISFFLTGAARKTFMFFLSFILFSFLMANAAFAGSFAAGPGTIEYENLLKSGYAEAEIYANNPEDVPVDVDLSAGGQVATWISFYPASLRLDPHETGKAIAIIRPPWDVANGQYNGTIMLVSRPDYEQTHDVQYGMNIETAITLRVSAEIIGEQIIDYSVSGVSVNSVEVGYAVPVTFSGKNNGNVRVIPLITVDIYDTNRSVLVLSKNITAESVMPTAKNTETIYISTENIQEGQYWANISISVFDYVVATKMITFDILEEGALTLAGELVQVTTSKLWANPEDIVRIDAVFKNTGQISAKAKFKGEVYLDDDLVGMIESDEMLVGVGDTVNLTTYYTPDVSGRYAVEGVVYYSGKSTYQKGTVINVYSSEQSSSIFVEYRYLLFTSFVIFLVFLSMRMFGNISERSTVNIDSISQKYDAIDASFDKAARKSDRLRRKIRHLKNLGRS